MKYVLSIVAFAAMVFFSINAWADEVRASVKQVDGKTIVYCSPDGIDGGIRKATITVYESNGHQISVTRGTMDVSIDNVATYVLPGTYMEVAGKCKLFTSYRSEIPSANPGTSIQNGIARADFYMSMK